MCFCNDPYWLQHYSVTVSYSFNFTKWVVSAGRAGSPGAKITPVLVFVKYYGTALLVPHLFYKEQSIFKDPLQWKLCFSFVL